MTFAVEWDFPARRALERVPWPKSGDVAAVVYRFATTRAPLLRSDACVVRGAGYWIRLRVDQKAGTVLVLYLEPV